MRTLSDWLSSLADVDFRPHPFLRSGHLQTCMAAWWTGPLAEHSAGSHIIDTTDGDRLVLHDDLPTGWRDGDPVALLIHGLGGCHRSSYMVRIAARLVARGIRAFRMDMRGCGKGMSLARYPGHAGRSEDVDAIVRYVKGICSQSSLLAVGFSLGGNVLLKWLGESGQAGSNGVDRAIAVSVPIDLVHCAKNIQRRERLVYNRWFVRGLMSQIACRRDQLAGLADLDLAIPPKTLYEFDDRVTAKLSGFSGADEYYARSSSGAWLKHIQTPTLIISAEDDPLIPPEMYSRFERSSAVNLKLTRHGGHVGFFGRRESDPDWHWLDWRVVDLACIA